MFEADLFFSCGENFLPVADSWLVIDVLRATTVITRWFELGGSDLYPVKTPNEARLLVLDLKERGLSPLLMGEINGIPPEGFDLGNSPVELTEELVKKYSCGVMSTTNGTVALNEAFGSGSPVIAVSFRNLSACLDYALTFGDKIGILCSGRKKRPSWEDTLCAGALLEKLNSKDRISMSDAAKIAFSAWQNQDENLLSFIEKSEHAGYLKRIGYGRDIIFASEIDVSTVVPVLERLSKPDGSHLILRNVSGNSKPYGKTVRSETGLPLAESGMSSENLSSKANPSPLTARDPFEELLMSYLGKEELRKEN